MRRALTQLTEGAFTTITQPAVNGEPVFEETFSATDCAPGDFEWDARPPRT